MSFKAGDERPEMTKAVQKKRIQAQAAPHQTAGETLFADEQGEIYRRVINEARAQELNFALGGGFAINAYTGLQRGAKDLDMYVLPSARRRLVDILSRVGMKDYYEQSPYDRNWIYRGYAGAAIVDVIWAMANQVAEVDEAWLTRGDEMEVDGKQLRLLPPEELLWTKIYVIQRDRCDWPDLLNLLYSRGETMNWEHLLKRLGKDTALLTSVLTLFVWLCPGRARTFPDWLWKRLKLISPPSSVWSPEINHHHVGLIDSRPWFVPALATGLAQ
jgi:hypothetical protein